MLKKVVLTYLPWSPHGLDDLQDISGNSLDEIPDWLGALPILEHLDLSEQRRGWRSGVTPLHTAYCTLNIAVIELLRNRTRS